jgi:hypothetical protein
MTSDYTPGGRWVRLLGGRGTAVAPIGRWHLALRSQVVSFGRPGRVVLTCGRELRPRTVEGGEVISTADVPYANLCEACHRFWRQRVYRGEAEELGIDEPGLSRVEEPPAPDAPFWDRSWILP